jgi:hypothetical protein
MIGTVFKYLKTKCHINHIMQDVITLVRLSATNGENVSDICWQSESAEEPMTLSVFRVQRSL